MTPTDLHAILEAHTRWRRGEKGGNHAYLRGANLRYANFEGADLRGASFQDADLQGAYLQDANLQGANLQGANLQDADLRGADLRGADLQRADLRYADLPTGETWETYLSEVVPSLCAAGGVPLERVAQAWDCHDWDNCPMAVAFGAREIEAIPALHRPRAQQFIQFFDAGLMPASVLAVAS